MLLMLTGVISTTRKVKIPEMQHQYSNGYKPPRHRENLQFDAVASEAARVRIANGAYSAGTWDFVREGTKAKIWRYLRSHGIARSPTAKKKLKRNSITMATIPPDLVPVETDPARIAMQAH